jgi:hypothetical protein
MQMKQLIYIRRSEVKDEYIVTLAIIKEGNVEYVDSKLDLKTEENRKFF